MLYILNYLLVIVQLWPASSYWLWRLCYRKWHGLRLKKASWPYSSCLGAAHFIWPLTPGFTTSMAGWAKAYWAAVCSSAPHINIQRGTGKCERTHTHGDTGTHIYGWSFFLRASRGERVQSECMKGELGCVQIYDSWRKCMCDTQYLSDFHNPPVLQRPFVDQYWSFDFYLKLVETKAK